jgi:chromosome segregation protein
MYLKSLEIIGFKSFAKKTNIGFTTPVTAIVGPNGSGKSNVAEAFRFVLGEQSVKSMRGKKGEDLIWNGGKDIPRLNRASVKATFDNTTRLFSKCDFDEVTIERVINRDGNNEYLLNNTEVRLKDINEILAEAHVGTTGHHIISQGEADSVLSCSNMERREIIEDALGLKIYEWKKTESEKKLQKTLDNMQQIDGLRKELSPHIRFLKKQVEKIEKSREDRGTLLNLYREYFAKEKSYLDFEKNRLGELLSTPKKDLSNIEREIENLRNTLDLDNTQNKDEDKLLEIGNKIAEIRQKKDVLTRETGRLDGAIYSLNKTIEREKLKNSANEDKIIYVRDVETLVIQIESLHSINDVKVLFNEVINNLKTSKQKNILSNQKIKNILGTINFNSKIENARMDDKKIDFRMLKKKEKEIFKKIEELAQKNKTSNKDRLKMSYVLHQRLSTKPSYEKTYRKGLMDQVDPNFTYPEI